MKPLVTIVIPAYNHAEHLAEAIQSVLTQDYGALEVIVIDDGSTDYTREVLQGLAGEFRWETQTNVGQALTLTKGWGQASGEILAYLSADDRLAPGAASAAVASLARHPDVVATYCDFNLIDPFSRLIRTVRLPEFNYTAMLAEVSCPIGPGAFFRRSAYIKAGPWNPAFRQMPDYDFWLRLGAKGRFLHISEPLADFRVHPGSQTYSKVSAERANEPVKIVEDFLAQTAVKPEVARRARASARLVAAQLHIRSDRLGAALAQVRDALRLHPQTLRSARAARLLANALMNRVGHRLLWSFRALVQRARSASSSRVSK